MTLSVSGEGNGAAHRRLVDPPGPGRDTRKLARGRLIADVLDEMTRWDSRDRMGAFRKWHQGALSLIHLNVLAALHAAGPLPMSRLAESLDVSDASATGIVDRMERRGLVERRHGTDDRRVVTVHLTERGSATLDELGEQRRERLSRLLERMTDGELAGFLAGVRALHAAKADPTGSEPAERSPGDAAR